MTIAADPQLPAVPVRAMTTAILLATRLGSDTTPEHLMSIAKSHGGGPLIAHALEIRLSLLAMLVGIDPALNSVTAKLGPDEIGSVLARFPVLVREGRLDFDGDALVAALRLAADPEGAA